MKFVLSLLVCVAITGCATHQTASKATTGPVTTAPTLVSASTIDVQPADYAEAPAKALAFDPPVISNDPPLQLSRDDRRPAAFVGFDGPITTSYWIHTDDWQDSSGYGLGAFGANGWGGGSGDRYQREAQFDQIGVRTR